MNKKLKVFSFPDRNPEYLELQINSYNKYIKDNDTELIIINASTNHEDEINQICNNTKVNSIKYTSMKEGPFDTYYLRQLNWFRDEIQKLTNEYILILHSDMFFINKLDYKNLMLEKEIYYSPQYRNSFTGNPGYDYRYIWDGIILFNSQYFNENNLTSYFNWDYIKPITDGGGMMKDLLNLIKHKYVHNYLEFWNYTENRNNIIDTHLNGNVRYNINIVNAEFDRCPHLINRSFEYELIRNNYKEYYIDKFKKIKSEFIDPYDFPNPAHIDIIQEFEKDIKKSFVLHFKTGVGSQPFYNKEYSRKKLDSIEKIINRNI